MPRYEKKTEFGTVLYISKWKTIIINETMLTACQLRRRRHLCFIDELFLCSHDIFHLRNRHNWCLAAYFRCSKTKKNMSKIHWESSHSSISNSSSFIWFIWQCDFANRAHTKKNEKKYQRWPLTCWCCCWTKSHEKEYSVGTMSQHWNNYWIIVYLCVKLLSFHSFQIKTKWITWVL